MKVAQSCSTLCDPKASPGQNTGGGSLSLLQGIFPTQGLNPSFPHFRQILYLLSHQGSPRKLEWVDYPFFRRSSQPRNWNLVSCTAGRFFTCWAMREAHVATAAAKSLQSCPTLCNPIDGSPPGSPSPGFSRQEHWSGSVMSKFFPPHGLLPTRLFCPWDFLGKDAGVGRHFLLQGIFWPKDQTQVSSFAGRFFTTEPPGKPFNTSRLWNFCTPTPLFNLPGYVPVSPSNRICILLLCENCTYFNYVELVHGAFQVYFKYLFNSLISIYSYILRR